MYLTLVRAFYFFEGQKLYKETAMLELQLYMMYTLIQRIFKKE